MPSQVVPSFLIHVAANVRSRRQAKGLSQKGLAETAGISLRMIGGIENGTTSVSTATLDRIGIALDATLSDLVADPAVARGMRIDRLGWSGDEGGEGILRWSIEAKREVELWEWRLMPGDRYKAAPDPAGWHVMLFVVEGRLTLELDGDSYPIEGEAHVFASNRPHAFINASDRTVRFYRSTVW